MKKKDLGLYIHIPFCVQKCYYCDFVSYPNQLEKQETYVEKILEEIESQKEIINTHKVTTIYIGGGTPSAIDSTYIKKILTKIKQLIREEELEEVTIEVNPGTVTKEKLEDYQKAGINRISMGLQSANNRILKEIGRIHTWEEFQKNYSLIAQMGFTNLNVDLMLGLPNQSIQDLKESIEKVINLKPMPNHISVYSLIIEPDTKMERLIESGTYKLPEEDTEREEYAYMKNKLELAGYHHYEISNFAKPGYEAKHNSNCWEQKEYLGFGVAAHSYCDNKRYANSEDLAEYLEKENKEQRIIHEIQNEEDKQKEYMLLGLRTIEGVAISKFKEQFGHNPIYLYRRELEKLVKQELLEIDLDQIKLTRKGIDLANLVWEEFI